MILLMNLALVGFLVVGILFAIYAYTFYTLAEKKLPAFLRSYAYAYFALALAFFIWAFATVQTSLLGTSVIIGDVLMLVGSICLLSVLLHSNRRLKIAGNIIGSILTVVILYIRFAYFPPMATMTGGLIFFNTQLPIALVFVGAFVLVWLPTNIMVARRVTLFLGVGGMSFVYSFIYVVSTISAVLFVGSTTPTMIIGTFVLLGLCFVMLIYSNYILNKMLPSVSEFGSIPEKLNTQK